MHTVRTRVKVCGLTHPEDAREAVAAGADGVGVIFTESPRQLTIEEAEDVLAFVPPLVARIGVFVDPPAELVEEAAARLGLTAAQFHGSETPEQCATAGIPVIKAFRVGPDFDPADMEAYRGSVSAVLLDTYVPGVPGGSGKAFAWDLLPELPRFAPLIVAGGLNPVNVGAVIKALRPYAVDVCSGVEERPRHKDRMRLHAFVASVRAADQEVR